MRGYLIGSLKNPQIPVVAQALRAEGYEIVDDWYAAGPDADDIWRDYERARGHDLKDALNGIHAKYAFMMDREQLQWSDFGVLVLPAGKSAHLELGWMLGQGKPAWILFDKEPERFDLMYKFATGIATSVEELKQLIEDHYGSWT